MLVCHVNMHVCIFMFILMYLCVYIDIYIDKCICIHATRGLFLFWNGVGIHIFTSSDSFLNVFYWGHYHLTCFSWFSRFFNLLLMLILMDVDIQNKLVKWKSWMAAGLEPLIQTRCSHLKCVVAVASSSLWVGGQQQMEGPAKPSDCASTRTVKVG